MNPSTAPSKIRLKAMGLNELQELQVLSARLLSTINDFRHVSDHLPPLLETILETTNGACLLEMDRRFNNSEN